jgi:peptidoglycan/LPS O-acetylase OafA/YrhL
MGTYALASLGSALLLVAFLGIDPKLLPGPAVYLGRISFGLYIYHDFARAITIRFLFGHVVSLISTVTLLRAVSTPVLTVLMAALSYRYFETPFLKMKKRHTVIESQPVLDDR